MDTITKHRQKTAAAILACGLLACLLFAVGCTQAASPGAQQKLTENNALVLYAEDGNYLFADTDSGTVFYPLLDEAVIVDEDGRELPLADLAVGDMVIVAGDGSMTMSYPAQYPAISRVTIVSSGNMDDVASYESVVNTLFPPIDPNTVPAASLTYRNSSGQITLALNAYEFEKASDSTSEARPIVGTFVDESGVMVAGTPDANLTGPVEANLQFDRPIQNATLVRKPIIVALEQRVRVDLDASQEDVSLATVSNDELAFTFDPGYAYRLNISFAEGEASYAFFAVNIAS